MADTTAMVTQEGAIAQASQLPGQFNRDQVELIKTQILRGGSDDELKVFLYQCSRTGLDPFARQIYAIKRWDDEAKKEIMGVQVSIDGFRLIAERTKKYQGQTPIMWCGKDGEWKDVWLSDEHPAAARVGVIKIGFAEPLYRVARFSSYAGKKKDGTLTRMWLTKGDIMIAKCAEALALRTAFPQELAGFYTDDEMEQAQAEDTKGGGQAAPPASKPAPKKEKIKKANEEQLKIINALLKAKYLKNEEVERVHKDLLAGFDHVKADDAIAWMTELILSRRPEAEENQKEEIKLLAGNEFINDGERTAITFELTLPLSVVRADAWIAKLAEVIAQRTPIDMEEGIPTTEPGQAA